MMLPLYLENRGPFREPRDFFLKIFIFTSSNILVILDYTYNSTLFPEINQLFSRVFQFFSRKVFRRTFRFLTKGVRKIPPLLPHPQQSTTGSPGTCLKNLTKEKETRKRASK